MPPDRNPYRLALSLEELDLPDLIASGAMNGRAAIMAALVEHGAPLSLEDIARRVHALGMGESRALLLSSLRKAWGGSSALHKLKDGRLSLDVNAPDAQFLKIRVELAMRESPEPTRVPDFPPDTQVLTEAELRASLLRAHLHGLSGAKLAAIVTEATGRAMRAAEINAYVAELTSEFKPIGDPRMGTARSPLVTLDEDGRLRVNTHASGLQALRKKVRQLGARAQHERESEIRIQSLTERREKERAVQRAEVLARRRCLLHAYEVGGSAVLVAHADPASKAGPEYVPPELLDHAGWLPDCDVLIGIDIFALVDRLGIDPGQRRLVDLGPPQKTKSLGHRGPPLKLTTDRLLRHTLGSWARLASKTKIRTLAQRRDAADLRAVMEADLDTLVTYYWYGVRNRFLSACWDDYDMQVPAPFAEAGDSRLDEIMEDLVGHEVWIRLRGARMSDPPEDLMGVLTHASWLSFTLTTSEFKLQAPQSMVLGVESIGRPRR